MSSNILNHLNQHIEQDVRGKEEFEKNLEKKAKESIKKLKEKGKLSDQELKTVYTTNYKKLFSGEIKTLEVLTKKISDLDQLTNKLIAKYLNEKINKKEENPRYKKCVYLGLGIDSDISKNGKIKNVMKGVIDELFSIPEMFVELVKHPLDSVKAIYDAISNNFSATVQKIMEQYADVVRGLWTPEDQYKTWRSAALIILTLLPGGVLKGAWKLWTLAKNTLKVWLKTWKSLLKSGVKETTKKVISASKEVGKKVVNSMKEAGKKSINAWKKIWQKGKNTINQIKNTWKNIVEKVKNRQLKTDMKNLNKEVNKIKSSPKPDLKKIKELEKQITQKQREIRRSNTKLGLDNNKINMKKRGLERANHQEKLAKKLQEDLKTEMGKATPDPKVISKLKKDITKHTHNANVLRSKWKSFDTKITKQAASVTRAKVWPALIKKGFSVEGLKAVLKSPLRLKIVQNLKKYFKARSQLKRLQQEITSLDSKLNKVWKKSWKTAYETVMEAQRLNLKVMNLKQYQNVIKWIRQKDAVQKAITKTTEIQNIVEKNIMHSLKVRLIKFWVITKVSGQALNELEKDATLAELSMYLQEDNDQFNNENETNSWLESWKTEISNDMLDDSKLNTFTDEELKTVKIILTGKASKTWSEEVNTRIATERANNMKKMLLEKYPTLDQNNIEIQIALQPQDSEDKLSDWQGYDINILSDNQTYVADYENISRKTPEENKK